MSRTPGFPGDLRHSPPRCVSSRARPPSRRRSATGCEPGSAGSTSQRASSASVCRWQRPVRRCSVARDAAQHRRLLGTCGAYVGAGIALGEVVAARQRSPRRAGRRRRACPVSEPMSVLTERSASHVDALVRAGARPADVATTLAITVDDAAAARIVHVDGRPHRAPRGVRRRGGLRGSRHPVCGGLGVANRVGCSRARRVARAPPFGRRRRGRRRPASTRRAAFSLGRAKLPRGAQPPAILPSSGPPLGCYASHPKHPTRGARNGPEGSPPAFAIPRRCHGARSCSVAASSTRRASTQTRRGGTSTSSGRILLGGADARSPGTSPFARTPSTRTQSPRCWASYAPAEKAAVTGASLLSTKVRSEEAKFYFAEQALEEAKHYDALRRLIPKITGRPMPAPSAWVRLLYSFGVIDESDRRS